MILVHRHVVADIEKHVARLRNPRREVVGGLRWEESVTGTNIIVLAYTPVRNESWNMGSFKTGHPIMYSDDYFPCHSHPEGGFEEPSRRDLSGASERWLERPYAIYHVGSLGLRFYELFGNRRGWRDLEWQPL